VGVAEDVPNATCIASANAAEEVERAEATHAAEDTMG